MQIDKNIFDPALLSFPDIDFLLVHAGEQPLIAFRSIPPLVNVDVVKQWIERFYELGELEKATAGRSTWVGLAQVKEAIRVYLEQRKKWQTEHERYGAPKFPSLYAFDSRGNAHYQAPGSDSGRVKTYFGPAGERIPFAVALNGETGPAKWVPEWIRPQTKGDLKLTEGENTITCGVPGCGHVETFRPGVRASRAAARARISRHLRRSETETEAHYELYTLEFGSS